MVHVRCPKCQATLRLSELGGPQQVRCPACAAEFRVSPPVEQPIEQAEAGMGRLVKALLGALALVGIVLLACLIYSVVGTRPTPEVPSSVARAQPALSAKRPEAVAQVSAVPKPSATKPAPARPVATRLVTTRQAAPVAPAVDLSPKDLFAAASPAVVRVIVMDRKFEATGQGSGFFVSAAGLLVTNHHVIKGAHFATVKLASNATLFVDSVLAVDPDADLAVLKVNGSGLPFLDLSDGAVPEVGTRVYAIGNPAGLANTLSEGLVSGIRDDGKGQTSIQTNAAISPGSSGGPLLSAGGKVVGVTKSYLPGGQNLNFAVPAGKIAQLLKAPPTPQTLASAGGQALGEAATAKLEKAWAAIASKDWSAATRILTELRKTEKNNPVVWFALGFLHGELGNLEIAIENYKAAVALKPDYTEAYFVMGAAYDGLKRYTEATAAYEKAVTASQKALGIDPEDAGAYLIMGGAYAGLKRYRDAIAAFEKAVAIKPDYAVAYRWMGSGYLSLKRHTEAIAAFKKALAIKPDDTEAYVCMGLAYSGLKRYSEAIAEYEKAVAIKPDWAEAYGCIGGAYSDLKRYSEAIAAYKKALAIKPGDANAYVFMGAAYSGLARYDEAIAAYKKALAIEPDAAAYVFMGGAYSGLKRYGEAIAAYEKALAIKPDLAVAYFLMGLAYKELGQYAASVAAYEEFLRLDPADPRGDPVREDLPRLRRLAGAEAARP